MLFLDAEKKSAEGINNKLLIPAPQNIEVVNKNELFLLRSEFYAKNYGSICRK